MKALTLVEYKRFALEDAPEPALRPDSVMVQVKACGICGSDVHGMDGSTGRRRPPIIMGHEAAGVIVRTGPDVQGWETGARVTFDSTIYCGSCEYCREGRINLCDQRRVLGVSCEDYRQHGAFAQFVAVPQRVLYRLPDAMPFEHAALTEPLSIAFHALHRAGPQAGGRAVVVGAGLIGLLIIQALRRADCNQIMAVDTVPDRLSLAKKLGATDAIKSGPAALGEIMEWTGGRGAENVFEAVGISPTVDLAIRSARKGGSVTLVGNVAPTVEFPLQACVTRELSVYGSCASCGEYPACLDALAKGEIQAAPLVSAVAPLEDGPRWFERLYGKEPGLFKVVLQP
ncbi:MAG TPA: galactitol-1-phosphate 5-dehydrogenase [Verrucomicrobiae bacterium]